MGAHLCINNPKRLLSVNPLRSIAISILFSLQIFIISSFDFKLTSKNLSKDLFNLFLISELSFFPNENAYISNLSLL